MKLSEISVKRPVTTIMVMLIVILLGIVSLTGISLDLLPDIELPMAGVMTVYPGASPSEIEELITEPIESELSTVSNLDYVSSISRENMSIVMFKFNWGTDINEATSDLRDKLELVKQKLPTDIQNPSVIKFDPTMMPAMQLSVSNDKSVEDLTRLVKDDIKPQLEKVQGVAAVEINGGLDQEIKIEIEQEKLSGANLTLDKLIGVLKAQNISIPAGTVDEDDKTLSVRATSSIDNISDIENIIVGMSGSNSQSSSNQLQSGSRSSTPSLSQMAQIPKPIYLKDIAKIEETTEKITAIHKIDNKDALELIIRKEGSADTVSVAKEIKERVKEIENDKNISIAVTMDQSEIIEMSIKNVAISGIIGALIAIVVLFFFLRNLGSALVIGLSIPFSVIATFVLMYFTNITMNLMSLGGLVLGIGMLVDNSIVVLENVFRHMEEEGKATFHAAIEGTKEVSGAIIASTLTTLAVFLPVVFLGGLAGQLFKEFSLTVTFSLAASLLVALTIVPMLASKFLKIKSKNQQSKQSKLVKFYEPIVRWSLKHKFTTIVIALVLLAGSIALVPTVGTELIPDIDRGNIAIKAKLPNSTNLNITEETASKIEEKLLGYEDIETISTTIGSSAGNITSIMSDSGSNIVSFNIKLKNQSKRENSTAQFINQIEPELKSLINDDTTLSIAKTASAMMDIGSQIEYSITGGDREQIENVSNQLIDKLKQIDGLIDVSSDASEQKPEMEIKVDKEKAMSVGLMPAQIVSSIRSLTGINKVMEIQQEDNVLNVNVILAEDDINSVDDLKQLSLLSPTGKQVKLGQVVEINEVLGPISIIRKNQNETITVSASLNNKQLGTAMSEIGEKINEIELPEGMEISQAGAGQMQDESFNSLYLALILSIVLVYMVMAAQFERLLHPFIIMFSLPLAVVGAILGLLITGMPIGLTAMVGFVVLVGIVVNNGIVLITYVEQLQDKGMEKNEALVQAGKTRMRPIMMTALTTIVGLIPLAIGLGEGSEMMQPMAVVVIGGLLTSTLLTLIIIPVIYSIVDRTKNKIKDKISS